MGGELRLRGTALSYMTFTRGLHTSLALEETGGCVLHLCLCAWLSCRPRKTYLGDEQGWLFKQTGRWAGFWYGRSVGSDIDSLRPVQLNPAWSFSAAAKILSSAAVPLPRCAVTKAGWLPVFGYRRCGTKQSLTVEVPYKKASPPLWSLWSVTGCREAQMLLCLLKLWAESFGLDHYDSILFYYQKPIAKRGFCWGKGGKERSASGEGFWMAWISLLPQSFVSHWTLQRDPITTNWGPAANRPGPGCGISQSWFVQSLGQQVVPAWFFLQSTLYNNEVLITID